VSSLATVCGRANSSFGRRKRQHFDRTFSHNETVIFDDFRGQSFMRGFNHWLMTTRDAKQRITPLAFSLRAERREKKSVTPLAYSESN